MSSPEVLVFSFKDGLLSAVAHDLKLRVERFELDPGVVPIKAWFDAASLKVVTPMRNGTEAPHLLPSLMFGEIEKNIRNDVLQSGRHPRITFESTALSDTFVVGKLTLCGVTREVRGTRQGNLVTVRFDQRDFGIKPYVAMFGTLKVKPEVVVTVKLAP